MQTKFQTRSLDPAATQQAISGHQLMFDDNPKNPNINLHAYKDLNIVTNNNHQLNVQGKTTTTVQNGNYVQQVGGKLIINANKAVHLVNGNSRISITPSDIILEADKIVMGAPQGTAAAPITNINNLMPNGMEPAENTPPTQQDPQAQAQQMPYPTLSLNLAEIPIKTTTIPLPNGFITLKLTLAGNVTFKKEGTYTAGNLDLHGYSIEGRNNLSNFFAYLNLETFNPKQLIIGSNITGEFTSTSVQFLNATHTIYSADEQFFSKKFSSWNIEGSLGYVMDAEKHNGDPASGLIGAPWYDKDWGWVEKHFAQLNPPEKAGLIILGVGLAIVSLPEDLIVVVVGAGGSAMTTAEVS